MRRSNLPPVFLGLAGLLVFVFSSPALRALPGTIKIPDSTPVPLSLMDSLSSATNDVDDPVHFEVTDDVKVGDVVALPKGSTATGHVVESEGRKRMGRGGKLNFTVDYVKAPDGTNVRLRASSTRKGKDETGTVIIGTVLLSPLFLIRRGHETEIPKGTKINAYVDGDREVTQGGAPSTSVDPPKGGGSGSSQSVTITQEVELSTVIVKSNPDGADIVVDGKYVGNTPSTITLKPGDHAVSLEKTGFKNWQRTMTASSGGIVTIDATLEKLQ
ncbi:MAG TPA: PEGA domain-containing protein [Terriglobia bacterium]|nr:PEGA domain-containing protein [Terriglobia bacterium]